MSDFQSSVKQFHEKFGCSIGDIKSGLQDKELRKALIAEEAQETIDAINNEDLVGTVDGLCDLIYVCYGAAVTFGIDLQPFLAEVHRSNMTKTLGSKKPNGKVQKGPDFEPPRIKLMLENYIKQKDCLHSNWVEIELDEYKNRQSRCLDCGSLGSYDSFLYHMCEDPNPYRYQMDLTYVKP